LCSTTETNFRRLRDSQNVMAKANTIHFEGTAVSPGFAMGRIRLLADVEVPANQQSISLAHDPSKQRKRLEHVLARLHEELGETSRLASEKIGKHAAMVFSAQKVMLSDPALVNEIDAILADGQSTAEQAVDIALDRWSSRLDQGADTSVKQHSEDLCDLRSKILGLLQGSRSTSPKNLQSDTILGVHRLLPSEAILFSSGFPAAVMAETLEPSSHAALLLRELGTPCVAGLADLFESASDGDTALVDAAEGQVILNPDPRTETAFRARMQRGTERSVQVDPACAALAVTQRGTVVKVLANASRREEVERALNCGADGIGLLRTEAFFLVARKLPSADEFREHLSNILTAASGSEVNIRLPDLGGDRQVRYLKREPEPNPALGCRGIRFLLTHRELLDLQLEALLQLHQKHSFNILLPFITLEAEVVEVRERLRALAEKMGVERVPPLGMMIETPAAALSTSSLSQHIESFSVGSNDLTQFTMAACRQSSQASRWFVEDHPAILTLLTRVAENAGHKDVTLCGSLAGRTDVLEAVLHTGIRRLSVPAPCISEVKSAVRALHSV
jgi:phosphoenolpyruvate-protein kinase (PTS system EI component)